MCKGASVADLIDNTDLNGKMKKKEKIESPGVYIHSIFLSLERFYPIFNFCL